MIMQLEQVAKSYGSRTLFTGVNFKLEPYDRLALVGANGAGKTTLLRIITGQEDADSGRVVFAKDATFGYLEQEAIEMQDCPVFEEVLSAQKEVMEAEKRLIELEAALAHDASEKMLLQAGQARDAYERLGGYTIEANVRSVLFGLGFKEADMQRSTQEFSGGWQMRIALAKLLVRNPDVLLLDEPTNGLDIQSITWLEDFLIDFDNTVIVVSHDRHFLNKVCTHMADLDFGKIKLYVGNYDFWKESSELAAKLLADRNAKAEEKIKQLQEFVARFSANASKSRQATSRKKMLDKIELEEIVPSSRKYPFINFKAEREIGNDLLTVENLTVKIDGETILDNISFILRPGDKTALIGQNDIQTTALIRAIMGDIDYEGTVKWGVTTSRSYLPKDNSADFAGGESILDWLRQFASKEEDDNTFLRGFLGRMLFSGDEVNKPVNVLSGGEKVRVMLSKLMLLKSNVLVLDDPTNHLDLESISSLNDGLKNFKESIIFASHDHEFIQTLANHIIVLSKNGVIDRIDETYDEFLENAEVQAKVKELWKD